MSGIEKIAEAEARVADLQDTLSAVQAGLERLEVIAIAAEDAKKRSDQALMAAATSAAVAIAILIVGRRHD